MPTGRYKKKKNPKKKTAHLAVRQELSLELITEYWNEYVELIEAEEGSLKLMDQVLREQAEAMQFFREMGFMEASFLPIILDSFVFPHYFFSQILRGRSFPKVNFNELSLAFTQKRMSLSDRLAAKDKGLGESISSKPLSLFLLENLSGIEDYNSLSLEDEYLAICLVLTLAEFMEAAYKKVTK